jgi:hypothetical protein
MDRFLDNFISTTPNHISMFAKFFCSALAILLLFNFNKQLRYFKSNPVKIYGKHQKILSIYQLPTLDQNQFIGFGLMFLLSLALISFGVFPRFFALLALLCYFPYFNSIQSLSYIQRKTNLLPFVLMILALSPSLSNDVTGPGTRWELILIKIGIVQIYLSAGIQKLRQSGRGWYNGKVLQAYLLENYLWSDKAYAYQLAKQPKLCSLLSTFTLIFELTFWVVIFFPSLSLVYVGIAFFFHLGILVTMGINYLKYLSPVYLIFFTDIAFWLKDKLEL